MNLDSQQGLRTIKLTIEYDGTNFAGWQVQPERRTVQGELEKGLYNLTQRHIRVTGAGRTDAGVHALAMVASFRCLKKLPLSAFEKGMNYYLPDDIRIKKAEETSVSFDARKNAISRTYWYVLYRSQRVIGRQYGWYPKIDFSLKLMKQASQYLIGDHHWDAFTKCSDESVERMSRILDIQWHSFNDEIRFEITGVRFFHNMIRIILGTLLEVGWEKISPKKLQEILVSRDRTQAGQTIPPQGLFLVKVNY